MMLLQKPVVMDRQNHFTSRHKQGREVDIARYVNDVRVKAPRLERDSKAVQNAFA